MLIWIQVALWLSGADNPYPCGPPASYWFLGKSYSLPQDLYPRASVEGLPVLEKYS